MRQIFLSSPSVPKSVARGITITESTHHKTSKGVPLKPKEPRLRDWNVIEAAINLPSLFHLKPKEPRLRDWVEAVFTTCDYQETLLKAVGITTERLAEPINEFMFYPSTKRARTVIAIGSASHPKNVEILIFFFDFPYILGYTFNNLLDSVSTLHTRAGAIHHRRKWQSKLQVIPCLTSKYRRNCIELTQRVQQSTW